VSGAVLNCLDAKLHCEQVLDQMPFIRRRNSVVDPFLLLNFLSAPSSFSYFSLYGTGLNSNETLIQHLNSLTFNNSLFVDNCGLQHSASWYSENNLLSSRIVYAARPFAAMIIL
jgi:hypothetical protein